MLKPSDYKTKVSFWNIVMSIIIVTLVMIVAIYVLFDMIIGIKHFSSTGQLITIVIWFIMVIVLSRNISKAGDENKLIADLYNEIKNEVTLTFKYNNQNAALGRKETDLQDKAYLYLLDIDYDNDTTNIRRSELVDMHCDTTYETKQTEVRKSGVVKNQTIEHHTLVVTFANGTVDKIADFKKCKQVLNAYNELKKTDDSKWETL